MTIESFLVAVYIEDRERVAAAVRTAIASGTMYFARSPGAFARTAACAPSTASRSCDVTHRVGHREADLEPFAMTEQRATEARSLVLADRLSSVGSLAAGVAHEINNPLVAALANLERFRIFDASLDKLAKKTEVTEEIFGYVREANDGAHRVRSIMRDLTIYSRGDQSHRTPVIVVVVVNSALRMASHDSVSSGTHRLAISH